MMLAALQHDLMRSVNFLQRKHMSSILLYMNSLQGHIISNPAMPSPFSFLQIAPHDPNQFAVAIWMPIVP